MPLYEILVPTMRNNGKPIRRRCHKVWDSKVRAIAGGLTVLTPTKGQWTNLDGILYEERMIPVRIKCSEDQIHEIADFSARFYEQDAIMFYKITDDVWINHYDKSHQFKRK